MEQSGMALSLGETPLPRVSWYTRVCRSASDSWGAPGRGIDFVRQARSDISTNRHDKYRSGAISVFRSFFTVKNECPMNRIAPQER